MVLSLLLDPEVGGSTLFRNIRKLLPDYSVSRHKGEPSLTIFEMLFHRSSEGKHRKFWFPVIVTLCSFAADKIERLLKSRHFKLYETQIPLVLYKYLHILLRYTGEVSLCRRNHERGCITTKILIRNPVKWAVGVTTTFVI
jgi:hypothetical protein